MFKVLKLKINTRVWQNSPIIVRMLMIWLQGKNRLTLFALLSFFTPAKFQLNSEHRSRENGQHNCYWCLRFFGNWRYMKEQHLMKHYIPGVANQSETKSHISYCVTAKSQIIHMGTHEHHPISSSLAHMPLLNWIYCKYHTPT